MDAELAVLRIRERPSYRDHAACVDVPPSVFYPEDLEGPFGPEAAKAVCGDCPVRSACLTWAIDHHERYGVWGGMTETERRKVARDRKRATALRKSA